MNRATFRMKDIETRESAEGNPILAGYFVVFNSIYRISDKVTESIAAGAFDESIKGDVRALYNHNTDLILGRTSASTLTLKQDEIGLYGEIEINSKDTDAMNAYERVVRGDITGCSFGFDIAAEEYEIDEDENVHYTILKVDPLYEVSPCVFPAYEATSIGARDEEGAAERIAQAERLVREKELNTFRAKVTGILKGESNA